MRRWAVALALALAGAGCGGDEEQEGRATSTREQAPKEQEAPPAPTVTDPEPRPEETRPEVEGTDPEPQPETSPEDAPGGVGDEEPARSLALFTGEGGRITPRVIRVPSFISIRVELRSADEREYGLRFGKDTIRVSGGLSSVSTTIDGLRPGAAAVGTPAGAGTRVRIEATAEPGP